MYFLNSGGISNQSLPMKGPVIIFSVWHHVAFLPDDFLGEVVLPISSFREMTPHQNVDDLPAVIMSLRRPKEPRDGPYKVNIMHYKYL